MPRPKKQPELEQLDSLEAALPEVKIPYSEGAQEEKVKAFQMVVGVDLIGSKMSLSASRSLELKVHEHGVLAYSKTTRRKILIPWTNIKGVELL